MYLNINDALRVNIKANLMSMPAPTLHLICGKIAAGKSTLAAQLANAAQTIVIAEDDWLTTLFPDEISSLSDYARCSTNLRDIMGPHVVTLLQAGVSVVLDFPANTIANRAWMREIAQTAQVAHRLHYLDVPDDVCLARLRQRNVSGDHAYAATEAQFHQFTKHFVVPSEAEGFEITLHRPAP